MKHLLLIATALLGTSIAVAATEEPDSTKPVSAAQAFVTKATQDGMAEIQLGELAQKRSSDPKVKEFASRMIQDHTKANAELGELAKRKKLDVPTELDDQHARMLHAVGTKPPSEFDAEYGKHMMEAHESAVTLFQDAAAVSDKDISGFAKKTLPTLQKHQQMAMGLPMKPAASQEALNRRAAESGAPSALDEPSHSPGD